MPYSNVKRGRINAKIAKELRFEMKRFLDNSDIVEPIICMLKETNSKWTYGAYGSDNIKTLAPMLEKIGEVLLYEIDNLIIACPQYDQISELEGKIIRRGNPGEGLLLDETNI
jgi:hypothetical protein